MSSVAQPYPHVVDGDEVEDVKERLRVAIRDARKTRSPRRRDEAAQALAHVVLTIPAVAEARCVSVYAARATEPGTGVLLEELAARGVRVLMPVLGSGLQRDWAEYAGADDLRERAPGRPPEPGGPTFGPEALGDADVVIAPALRPGAATAARRHRHTFRLARTDCRLVGVSAVRSITPDRGGCDLLGTPCVSRRGGTADPVGA